MAELMFAGGKFVIGMRDETGTKDDGEIWGKEGEERGDGKRKGRTGSCHEILV